MIRIGEPVPEVPTEAYVRGERDPRSISLSEYRGRWVALFFYTRDFSSICPTEIQAFAELEPQFEELEAEVVAVSTDSYFSHKAWFERDRRLSGVAFPVLADTSHRLADAFGVLTESGAALRGTFILDPEGILRSMQINDLDVGRNVDETLRTIAALQTGELCPADWRPGELTITQQAAEQAA